MTVLLALYAQATTSTTEEEIPRVVGEHKGEVVMLAGRFPGRDELDLLAAPATLVVTDGQPSLRLDD
jgi:hypothetical protein